MVLLGSGAAQHMSEYHAYLAQAFIVSSTSRSG